MYCKPTQLVYSSHYDAINKKYPIIFKFHGANNSIGLIGNDNFISNRYLFLCGLVTNNNPEY